MSPRELASSGFFYCGIADQTRCAFCFITISQWEPEDNPAEEHRRHAPNCAFVLGLPVGNIPLSSVSSGSGGSSSNNSTALGRAAVERSAPSMIPSSSSSPRPPFLLPQLSSGAGDTCGRFQNENRPNAIPERAIAASTLSIRPPLSSDDVHHQGPSTSGDLSSLRVIAHQQARRPELTSLEARLATFADWPPGLEQRPAQLAEAGFYYMSKWTDGPELCPPANERVVVGMRRQCCHHHGPLFIFLSFFPNRNWRSRQVFLLRRSIAQWGAKGRPVGGARPVVLAVQFSHFRQRRRFHPRN